MSDDLPQPTNAEDLKRQKALDAIESTSIANDDAPPPPNPTTNTEALGKALGSITSAAAAPASKPSSAAAAVKVKPEDTNLVMDQFELSKQKATEALKANGGDVIKTLRALVHAT
ncbi:hypothetical protein DFH27DRAFT_522204 [Peziza echinospora]|nr:hypothetical protein DFH27DRAFT_522204 [Peziza echinospora]